MKANKIIKLIVFLTMITASVTAACIFCDKKFRKNYFTVCE